MKTNDKKSIKKILTIQNVSFIMSSSDTKCIKKRGEYKMRQRLVEERNSRDLTQKQVAEILGISEVYVRKIEKGLRNPGRETMLKFEQLYSVRDRELFSDLFQVSDDTKCIKYHSA